MLAAQGQRLFSRASAVFSNASADLLVSIAFFKEASSDVWEDAISSRKSLQIHEHCGNIVLEYDWDYLVKKHFCTRHIAIKE